MSTTRIPAYDINAARYCADCVSAAWLEEARAAGYDGTYNYFTGAEPVLDAVAAARGINRHDERSFDSSEFPKIVFSLDLGDTCGDVGCESDDCDGHPSHCDACFAEIE